ncbi:MAG: pyridoxal phosphate-dependent aminotransferase [Alphaproteobacteria bacterium]|nr:pyridoxal phosphate-dependent aminotransferase [Alphaproteobacteria bacterium]
MKLAQAISRLGTETAFDVMARAQQLRAEGKDIIDLSIGQSDFRAPDSIVEAAVKAFRDGMHSYTPAKGILPLREAVAADIEKRRGVKVSAENVLVVPGGKVTMFFAIQLFAEPGAEILYPNPGFPIYESLINYGGAKAVAIPILEKNNFAFSADDILERLTPNSRLLILNSPANPTGGFTPRSELEKLIKGLDDYPDLYILSDEIYGRMLYDGNEHASPLEYESVRDRVILLDGWSKTYAMAGLRLGYGLWPDTLIDHATRLAVNVHSCVNAPTQYAGLEALTGSQDEVEAMFKTFDERRKVIVPRLNELPGFKCHDPSGAFYVFPNITGTGMDSATLQSRILEEAGVATIPGTSFGSYGEGYIRLSYANSIENINKAVDRIGDLLSG